MPPRTRSSTGVLKQVVKYEESIVSESVDLDVKPKKRAGRVAKSESESDFGISEESSMSESESSQSAAVMSESDEGTQEEMEIDSEFHSGISKPVARKGKTSVHDGKEGRLPVFPEQWLKRTQEDLTSELLSEIASHQSAIDEVTYMSRRFAQLSAELDISLKNLLLKEMSNFLLHRLFNAGIARAGDMRTFSFIGVPADSVRSYFSKLQFISSSLISGDLLLNVDASSDVHVEEYIPYWCTH